MLIIEYGDLALKDLILDSEEAYQNEAIKYVDRHNILDEDIRLELIEFRIYQLVCRDNMESGEVFETKYEIYKQEFEHSLKLYRNKTDLNVGVGFMNVGIERG